MSHSIIQTTFISPESSLSSYALTTTRPRIKFGRTHYLRVLSVLGQTRQSAFFLMRFPPFVLALGVQQAPTGRYDCRTTLQTRPSLRYAFKSGCMVVPHPNLGRCSNRVNFLGSLSPLATRPGTRTHRVYLTRIQPSIVRHYYYYYNYYLPDIEHPHRGVPWH